MDLTCCCLSNETRWIKHAVVAQTFGMQAKDLTLLTFEKRH
jgi:hypothetical protein